MSDNEFTKPANQRRKRTFTVPSVPPRADSPGNKTGRARTSHRDTSGAWRAEERNCQRKWKWLVTNQHQRPPIPPRTSGCSRTRGTVGAERRGPMGAVCACSAFPPALRLAQLRLWFESQLPAWGLRVIYPRLEGQYGFAALPLTWCLPVSQSRWQPHPCW